MQLCNDGDGREESQSQDVARQWCEVLFAVDGACSECWAEFQLTTSTKYACPSLCSMGKRIRLNQYGNERASA